jgi:hypothetical protein
VTADLPFEERVLLCEEDLLALFDASDPDEKYALTLEDFHRAAARWTNTDDDPSREGYITTPGSDFDLLMNEIVRRFGSVPPGGDKRR